MPVAADSNSLGPFITPPVAGATCSWAPFKKPADAIVSTDWYDISPYLIGVSVTQRGRQYELNQFQAGTATIILDNNGRDFDPTFTSTTMGGLSPTVQSTGLHWTSIDLVPLKRFQVSVFYQDRTGELNTLFGYPSTNTTFPIFTGYVEGFPPEWEGVDYGQTTITLTDAFRLLQGIYVGPNTNFAPPGSIGATIAGTGTGTIGAAPSGTQIAIILDAIQWPGLGLYSSTYARALDTGLTTCVAQTLTSNSSALSIIQNIADTEIGQFFVAADGSLTFHDRGHRRNVTRSRTSQGTFSDQETA